MMDSFLIVKILPHTFPHNVTKLTLQMTCSFFLFRAARDPALQKDTDQPSKEEQGDKRVAIQPSLKKVGEAQVVI